MNITTEIKDNLSLELKQTLYSLMYKVMDADKKQVPEELAKLEVLKNKLQLNSSEIEAAQLMSLEDCRRNLKKFTDQERLQIKALLEEMAWADKVYVDAEKELISSLNLDINHYELQLISDWRDETQTVVGYYVKKDDGKCYFEDIRSLGFSELTYKDGDEIVIEVNEISGLEPNSYYEFKWTIELDESERGFHLCPRDAAFKPVEPKELVDRLYKIWEKSNRDVIQQMSDVQKMVNTQLTASSDGTFIYELLQNANDYPVKNADIVQLVDVEFHLTDHYLIYRHTGRVFSPRNIAAISKMSAGEKKKEKNAIGYKGIGFKTVFSENQYVYLESGEYSLRFDKQITEESSMFPWQIMPIWTSRSSIADEVKEVLSDGSNGGFRVQMAIRPDDSDNLRIGNKSFEYIFNDIFKDEKDILFIPNLRSVKVYYDGKEQLCRIKDPEKWALTLEPLVYKFTSDEVEENNLEVSSNKRMPEKYKDFEDTRVSFACQRNGKELIPVEKTRIYCYLPTQVSLGFPFLMNTDMIPTGPRDDFEKKVNFNHKIIKIAGRKLVEWLKALLQNEEYEQGSVYRLVPTFKPVENYEDFIDEFEESFIEQLHETPLVPVSETEYELVEDTIFDDTGLMSSGIMTDEDFYTITGSSKKLPRKELRNKEAFCTFQRKYLEKFDCEEQIWTKEEFLYICKDRDFINWASKAENNVALLNFLLEKGWLTDFADKEIFLDQNGCLHSASDTFYSIDEYLTDLQDFTDLFSYLPKETRAFFAGNEKWEDEAIGLFKEFDANEFMNSVLLSDDENICYFLGETNIEIVKVRITDIERSVRFYKFMAENVEFQPEYKELSFINDEGEEIEGFDDKFVFCLSKKGKAMFEEAWLEDIDVAFLSKDYTKETLDYFKAEGTFGVREYSDEVVVKDIILSEDYSDEINEAQQVDIDSSNSFVDFCYKNRQHLDDGALKNYALNVCDKEGDYAFVLSEDNVYFDSNLYDDLSSKEWIGYGWMYSLDEDYYRGDEEKRKFIKDVFGVEKLTEIRFYSDVVRPHLDKIFDNITGSNDPEGEKNVDFIAYLDANYSYIFEKEHDEDKYSGLALLGQSDDGGIYDISSDAQYVYLYDKELFDICHSDFFPDDLVDICTERYGQSKAVLAIRAKKYDFKDFFSNVISNEMETINENISTLEESIAFHQLVIDNKSELTENQQTAMKETKIFLYGSDDSVDESCGHKILSDAAEELASMGLVDFSDLDIIDPAYPIKGNNDYWVTRLENSTFSVSDFVAWIAENEDSFIATLEDEDLNVAFWQWAKAKLFKQADKLTNLPVLLQDDSTAIMDDVVYLSDAYISEGGIETIVKKYDEDANFISQRYIKPDDDVDSWQSFWTAVGVHSEVLDILTNTIIPRLDEIDDETLPATLAKHLSMLEELYGEDTLEKLGNLRVKGQDGNFYALSDSIYLDCEDKEPFEFITLPNQIVFSQSSLATERRLVKELVINEDGITIEGVKAWILEKINRYLDIQDSDDEDLLRTVHFNFINELSAMYREDDTSLTKYADSLKKVMILDENEEFANGTELTMSSVYKPFCDFQKYLPGAYLYTSDSYDTECQNYVGIVLRKYMDVNSDFRKADLKKLEDRSFAIYFWSKYLPTKKEKSSILGIKKFIKDELFNEIKCIPTKDYMSKPSSLYSTKISNYVKKTEDWENKLPIESIPNIEYANDETLFDLMPFKTSLSFGDCLYAIFSYNGVETRSTLVKWMLEQYDISCKDKVLEYRADEDALWTNVKNDKIHISKLYALDEGKDSTLLNEYFGSSEMIINRNYFPIADFIEACEMFQIDIITKDDLEVVPKNAVIKGVEAKHKLYVFALIIAGIESRDNWQNKYAYFKKKIDEISLCKCDAISIEYVKNRSLNLSLKKFHPDYEKKIFYYVGRLDSPLVFKDFVLAFINHLDIELSADYISNMMYEGEAYAIDLIKERNELMLDDTFKTQLDELIPGIKNELVGTEAYDIDEEEQDKRHMYTNTGQDSEEDEEETTDGTDIQMVAPTGSNPKVHVDEYERSYPSSGGNYDSFSSRSQSSQGHEEVPTDEEGNHQTNIDSSSSHTMSNGQTGASSQSYQHRRRINTSSPVKVQDGHRRYTDNRGWEDNSRKYKPQSPKPFSPDDVNNFGSKGVTRHLEVLEPSATEIADINRILGGDLSAEQVADQNYLAQLRLYRNLQTKGLTPKQSEEDFVRSTGMTNEHELTGGKYIHKCSAAGGIMYLSPSIWNKIADDSCVVCVYLGAKANEFMYFNSISEILDWINEDDIVIKLTGEERAEVVQELYSGVLNGVKGTAYTMIRISSNEKYNSLFAQLPGDPNSGEVENEEDY